jgi:preprotein translocase subunit Sss1
MAKVLDEILESFYAKLSESATVSESAVEELRTLLAAEKKPKADEFVAIFEKAAQEANDDSD